MSIMSGLGLGGGGLGGSGFSGSANSGMQKGALGILRMQFKDAGLPPGFADLVNSFMMNGASEEEAVLMLRQSSQWRTRFSGNEMRASKGLRELSPAEYLDKEKAISAQFAYYELPTGFYDDPTDFAKFIAADLGAQELGERLEARKAVVQSGAMTGVLQYAKDKYGLGTGDLMAFWIDPNRATSSIVRTAKVSQVGAAGARTGWGDVTRQEAEYLADLGITGDQAQQGYSQAAQLQSLTQDVGGDAGVSRTQLTDAVFKDDADAKRKVQRVADTRKARFQQGGQFAETRTGYAGLGSANT